MNQVTPGRPEADDDDRGTFLRCLLSEAGDPAVVPRPEYVSDLRLLILEHVGPPQRAVRWRSRLVVGSGLAAAGLAAVVLAIALSRPANAWAQVAHALQERTVGPHADARVRRERVPAKSGSARRTASTATRHGPDVEYHDHALRTFTKFVPAEGVVYRLPENPELMSQGLDFYRQLLDPKGPTKSPIPGMELIAQNRRDVVEAGRSWTDIELTLRVVAGDREQRMRFRVDPKTKLPHSLVFQSHEGPEGTSLFDYPDRGPSDIYDLGSANGQDRRPHTGRRPRPHPRRAQDRRGSDSTTTGQSWTWATARTSNAPGARAESGGPKVLLVRREEMAGLPPRCRRGVVEGPPRRLHIHCPGYLRWREGLLLPCGRQSVRARCETTASSQAEHDPGDQPVRRPVHAMAAPVSRAL